MTRQAFTPREYQHAQAGVVRVIAQLPAQEFSQRWADDMRSASAMFMEAGVAFEYIEPR